VAHTCPVCGFGGLTSPAYDNAHCASFEICPSCGTEFGYHDASKSHAQLRRAWIAAGACWSSRAVAPPVDWNGIVQLKAAGFDSRVNEESVKTQLLLDLADTRHMSIHFCEPREVEETLPKLIEQNIAVMEIDGSSLASREDVFKAFAVALRMPKGWYGDEEYAGNVDAFLEYLDDVVEWVPAKGHVVLVRHSEQLWRAAARIAGELVEWWQLSVWGHHGTVHLVFVW